MSLSHIGLALYLLVVGLVGLTDVTIDSRVAPVLALVTVALMVLEAVGVNWSTPTIRRKRD